MNPYRYLKALAWSGPILLVGTILCWGVLGHNIPPYSTALEAEALAALVREQALSIRIGMVLQMPVSVFYFVWGVVISKVMQTLERDNDVLSTLQLWGAGFTTLVLVIPCAAWLTVAYRPDIMEPRMLQMFHDFGWFFFDVAYSLTTMQFLAIGICFLSDEREEPLVAAWVCWFVMFVGVSFALLSLMPLVYDGPFSRAGLLNFWVEFTLFFLMMLVFSIALFKAINKLEAERHAAQSRA
ncbi:MAG: hypothetical protein RL434_1414 [Pseudomonadota bacterium]|jgi:hypothetical protein